MIDPLNSKPRILYLTHRVPFPPDKGDRIRNFQILRQLAKRSRIWLASLADEPVTADAARILKELCEEVAIVPLHRRLRWVRAAISVARGRSLSEGAFAEPAMRTVLRDWTASAPFDVAVASASSVAPYLRDVLPRTPAVIDVMDVDSQKWFDFAEHKSGPKRWLYRLEGRRVRKLERDLPRWAKAVSLVSRAEADLFESIAGPGTALAAACGVDLEYFQPRDVPEQPACVFVGALDYLPNVDAVTWFANHVWMRIRERHPAAAFWLVGRNPSPSLQKLTTMPGVKLIGQVPDVRPHLAAAAIAVIPLRIARGMQNKVLEACAMAKATVASPAALAALAAQPGTHLLSATTADEWVEAISGLLANADRRRELGQSGKQFVETEHNWERCLAPLVERILSSRGAGF